MLLHIALLALLDVAARERGTPETMATPLSDAQLRANNDAFLAAVQTGKSTEDALAAIPHPPTQGFRAAHAADPDHYDLDRYKEWALRGIVPDDVDNFVTGDEYERLFPGGVHGPKLPEHAVEILKAWLTSPQHFHHPYPTPEDQQSLMAQTGIDKKQLKNWFTNARRRIWKPMQRSAASHDYDEDGGGYYEEDESRAAHDVLAFASAADRARAVTVDSAGSSPSSHPAEGGLFDDFVLDAPAPSLRPPKRARTEPSVSSARCPFCRRGRVDTQLMPCAHLFHGQCLRPWLEATVTTPVCPLCSVAISNCVLATAGRDEPSQY